MQRADAQRGKAKADGKSGKGFEFRGVAYVGVRELRQWSFVKADALYAPTEDKAHANMMIADEPPEAFKSITARDEFIEQLTFIPAEKVVQELPRYRCAR